MPLEIEDGSSDNPVKQAPLSRKGKLVRLAVWMSLLVMGVVGVSVWTARSRRNSAATTLEDEGGIGLPPPSTPSNANDEDDKRPKPPCPSSNPQGVNQGELPNSDEECEDQPDDEEKDATNDTEDKKKPPCPAYTGNGVNQGELPNSDEECDEQLDQDGGN